MRMVCISICLARRGRGFYPPRMPLTRRESTISIPHYGNENIDRPGFRQTKINLRVNRYPPVPDKMPSIRGFIEMKQATRQQFAAAAPKPVVTLIDAIGLIVGIVIGAG